MLDRGEDGSVEIKPVSMDVCILLLVIRKRSRDHPPCIAVWTNATVDARRVDHGDRQRVEEHVAHGLEYLQFHCFSKMSRFSKFCKFLSETGEGLKLVAFFVAAQHLFVAYYEGDPDFAVYMGELR